MRISACLVAVLASSCALAPPISACGYEDPNSASFQRGALNFSYPKALYVQGALTQAYLNGVIELDPPVVKDLFGARYRKAAEMLRHFGTGLRPVHADDFSFTLVLIEPMLWTRYTVSDGSVIASVHVSGPEQGDLVVVSAEAALKEIVSHRLTFQRAEELGLVRFYGDPEKSARLRALTRQAGGV